MKNTPGRGITNEKLAPKIKKTMRNKGYDTDILARKMDEQVPYILEVLKGRRSIQLNTLIKFSKVLGTPILEFQDCIKENVENGYHKEP